MDFDSLAPQLVLLCLSFVDTRHKLVVSHTCAALHELSTRSPSLWRKLNLDDLKLCDEQLLELLDTADCSQLTAVYLAVSRELVGLGHPVGATGIVDADWEFSAFMENIQRRMKRMIVTETDLATAESQRAAAAAEAPDGRTTDILIAAIASKCPQLQRIDLSGRIFLTAEALSMLGGRELSSITFRRCNVPASKVADFSGLLEMRLFYCGLPGHHMGGANSFVSDADLAAIAANCPLLQRVAICGTGDTVTDAGIAALAQPHLLEIEFTSKAGGPNPAITDAALIALAEGCPLLDTVSFRLEPHRCEGYGYMEDGIVALANACPQLEKVGFTFMNDTAMLCLMEKCPKLIDINLRSTGAVPRLQWGITDSTLVAIAQMLPRLARLDVQEICTISESAIETLKLQLPKCSVAMSDMSRSRRRHLGGCLVSLDF
jgi:hypothetical protein